MSDETQAERAEAAATRRRWISLAEIVAVAGVLIAALTLWNSWSERRDAATDRVAADAQAARSNARVTIEATVESGGNRLRLRDDRHEISDVVIAFPKTLGVPVQRPVEPVIDSAPFRDALLQATDDGPDGQAGRLPVLVTVSYWDGDTKRSSAAIYDVIWQTEGRILRGRTLKLEALRLRDRSTPLATLDRLWPAKAK